MNFRLFILLSEMSSPEARKILGIASDATLDDIKKAHRKLVMIHHPDRGGNAEEFKKIQMAYELLKDSSSEPGNYTTTPRYTHPATPEWQTDLRSTYNTINREDFTDLNYLKKTNFEVAKEKGPVRRISITAFDGHFCRSSTTVFGNENIYQLMALAMKIWNSQGSNPYKTEAVFVQEENNPAGTVKVIWIKGNSVDVNVDFDSFNRNPSNDPTFDQRLKRIVDAYQRW